MIRFDQSTFVLQRRINRPPRAVLSTIANAAVFGEGSVVSSNCDGSLRLDESFRSVALYPDALRASAQLFGAHRRIARVELEIGPWSASASELVLRPQARHPERWSARRLQRYFAQAHHAADELTHLLVHGAPAPAAHEAAADAVPVG